MDLVERVVTGFVVALLCTPAGVSGAFLLLPLQVQVFDVPSPAVSATNLVYNVVATPAGAISFHREGRLDRRLATLLVAGAAPGVLVGVLLRSTWLASESAFAWVAAVVLVGLGLRLVLVRRNDAPSSPATSRHVATGRLVALGVAAGCIGGIYGFGGAAIAVPWLVSVERLSFARVAGAGLVLTLATSVIGLLAFALASQIGIGEAQAPEWVNGLAFGLGGAAGAVLGARLQPHVPIPLLRAGLGAVAVIAGLRLLV